MPGSSSSICWAIANILFIGLVIINRILGIRWSFCLVSCNMAIKIIIKIEKKERKN